VGVSYFEFTRVMPTTQIPGSVDLTRPPKEVYVIMRGLFICDYERQSAARRSVTIILPQGVQQSVTIILPKGVQYLYTRQ
jgi:hypothetical protein